MSKTSNLLTKKKGERCSICQGVLEEKFFGKRKELLCKSCYVDLQLEIAKEEPVRRFSFSNNSIVSKIHFCTNGQGFNLEIRSGDILDKEGRLLNPKKISFDVVVSKNGFYEELAGERIKKERLTVTTTFFNDGNIFFCRLKIPILLDNEGNFMDLGREEDFEKIILPSEEYVGRGLHFEE